MKAHSAGTQAAGVPVDGGCTDPDCQACRPGHAARCEAPAADIEGLRLSLAVIGVVGQVDGHDVIRRASVLDVADRYRRR